jgi:hypothetical protein
MDACKIFFYNAVKEVDLHVDIEYNLSNEIVGNYFICGCHVVSVQEIKTSRRRNGTFFGLGHPVSLLNAL